MRLIPLKCLTRLVVSKMAKVGKEARYRYRLLLVLVSVPLTVCSQGYRARKGTLSVFDLSVLYQLSLHLLNLVPIVFISLELINRAL